MVANKNSEEKQTIKKPHKYIIYKALHFRGGDRSSIEQLAELLKLVERIKVAQMLMRKRVAENFISRENLDWKYKIVFDDEIILTADQLEEF